MNEHDYTPLTVTVDSTMDAEMRAMARLVGVMESDKDPLTPAQRRRVIRWAYERWSGDIAARPADFLTAAPPDLS